MKLTLEMNCAAIIRQESLQEEVAQALLDVGNRIRNEGEDIGTVMDSTNTVIGYWELK